MNEPATPLPKILLAPEVMVGAALTVRVNGWLASLPIPLVAPMVIENDPELVGVPESTPVVESRLTPLGRVPVSEKVGAG